MLSGWGRSKKPKMLAAGKSGRYYFTLHSEYKMREYHLSRQRIIRVIRSPKRTETGIVENTIAVMQPASTKRIGGTETWTQELWVMYKVQKQGRGIRGEGLEVKPIHQSSHAALLNQPELKIISAWRYPGVSPERDPIPADILREIVRGLEESELAEEMAD